jgi:hypothetical protein
LAYFAAFSCKEEEAAPAGDGGTGGAATSYALNPPDYINVTACESFVDPKNNTVSECLGCCRTAGYSTGTYANQSHCVCGAQQTNTTLCAARAGDSTDCTACCITEQKWGGSSWGSGTCTCKGAPANADICAGAASNTEGIEPVVACSNCCLNNGYMGVQYYLGKCTCSG